MKERIQQRLREVEAEHGFRILYACESGSRAWGFASEDSDYDIRVLYAWPQEEYLKVFEPQAMFDYGVDEETLDLTGWDIRKALPLFWKANGSLMEWLFSPVVYFEDVQVMSEWRSLVPEFFVPKRSAAHYLGLSRKIWGGIENAEAATAKKYLYVLRALLASRHIVERSERIPVLFDELRKAVEISTEVAEAIDSMIAEKSGGNESDRIERVQCLDEFIVSEQERLDPLIGELSSEQGSVETLNQFFRKVIE